ncbi:MAG: DUF4062 domain-containing protein, partial [Pseudonocardiaceae bacterium]
WTGPATRGTAQRHAHPHGDRLEDVDACELYVCLVAYRYGYVPSGFDRSTTELEYRRAVQAGKPFLTFLLAEHAEWPMNRVERAAITRAEEFRQELEQRASSAT